MATKIEYDGSVVATIESGNKATLPIKDLKMKSDLVVTVPEATDSPLPTEVSTEAEMTALLTSGEVGGVYKYTGTTGTYENGALYVLEEEIGVSITLSGEDGGGNNGEDTFVKFGTPPTSQDDRDYYCYYGDLYDNTDNEIVDNVSVKVQPIAYIWTNETDSMAGYKLNNGSLINVGAGYASATEVQLSEGDALTLVSTWLD